MDPLPIVRLDGAGPFDGPRPAVAVGNFDGVHRGHQSLVSAARKAGGEAGGPVVVLTFDPHPSRIVDPARAPSTLMTLEQKASVLGRLGVERVAVLPFTATQAAATPEAFAREVLQGALHAAVVVVGANFRFGHDRTGDVGALGRLGEGLGFEVVTVEPVTHAGAPISSSRVREALGRGDVEEAQELLGRPYFVDGPVVPGDGRGRTLGIPTANVAPVNEILPAVGVYAGWVSWEGGSGRGAAFNVGRRPTFAGTGVTLEAHVLDFQGDLYGRVLRVEFTHRLREERRFPDEKALRAHIQEDLREARRRLGYSRTGA